MERNIVQDEVKETALQSPWVWALFIFMGTVFAANGALIYLAYKTRPNMVVADYYERGQSFETRTQTRNLMKDNLGWRIAPVREDSSFAGKPGPVTVEITDKNGLPAAPDAVKLYAYRPSDARYDFSLPMADIGGGRYSVLAAFPLKGVWDLIIEAEKGNDAMTIARRMTVLP